jgi:YlmC/YmxH family sporulation protein
VIRTSELQAREVVGVDDGRRLGPIRDLEIDLERGAVTALVLPGSGRLWGLFGREEPTIVPWSDVVRVGVDVILVRAPAPPSGRGRGLGREA